MKSTHLCCPERTKELMDTQCMFSEPAYKRPLLDMDYSKD